MNREVALENLLDLSRILKSLEIKFVLVYGTLLGAAREGELIAHDTDIDVGVIDIELDNRAMVQARSQLEKIGLMVSREGGPKNKAPDFFSVTRGGEYIDIMILRRRKFLWVEFLGQKSGWARSELFFPLSELTLAQISFPTPRRYEKLLSMWYGPGWHKSVVGTRANHHRRLRNFLRNLRARVARALSM